eukprot:m51a1_g5528 hypothetical protein (806) ;mRNA; f:439156-442501
MCRCGTFKPTNKPSAPPVPLTGLSFDISILGFCAEVTLRQRFENTESDPIEATYEFVLEDNAAVSNFSATIDGRTVEAKIKEKEAARDTYDDSIASGGGAYLLEQSSERRNQFSVSVGNLPPHKEAVVALTYVTEATVEDDLVVFTLPGGQPVKLGAASPKSELKAMFPKPYQIRANFEMGTNIKSITSKTHPITFEFGDAMNKASVSYALEEPPSTPDDFVLQVKLADPHQPMSRVQQDSAGSSVAMLSFYPKLEAETSETELLFLVDRSGSMAGSSMRQVKETLQFFLRSLSEGVVFNIIGFGTSHQMLFGESQPYNDTSLDKAAAHVASLEANLGGTNILRPLMEIFQRKPTRGLARQIFLLTDGQVSNATECINAVRNNANSTRVFTFGIGNDVDRNLVYGIAKAGEGRCELISESATMNQKVLRQLSHALKPALTEVRLDWGKMPARQAPNVLPPLFSGSRLLVFAFLEPGATPGPVTLSGKFGPTPFTSSVDVDPSKVSAGVQIVKLAAGCLIRDLEEGRSYLGKVDESRTKKEALEVSLRNGVLSKYSAFVAVEHREEQVEGTMQQRAIKLAPVADKPQVEPAPSQPRMKMAQAPPGMGRGGGGAPPSAPMRRSACAAPTAAAPSRSMHANVDMMAMESCKCEREERKAEVCKSKKKGGFGLSLFSRSSSKDKEKSVSPRERERAPGVATPTVSIVSIVGKQKASGCWMPDTLAIIGISPEAASKALPAEAAGKSGADAVWATFLVVAFLHAKFESRKVEWDLIAKKALKWALKTGTELAPGVQWESLAADFIAQNAH